MRISIIGAGRVGQTLGFLAREAGYEIVDVVSRSERGARSAVRFIRAGRAQAGRRVKLRPADLILISTPDDGIAAAVELIEAQGSLPVRAVVLHTSGALSSRVLERLAARGFTTGSCHPLQTFPRRARTLTPETYFCVEGDSRALRAARQLVRRIGGRAFRVPTEKKALYHAAAVMASGGVVSLLSESLDLLSRCGLGGAEARRVLLPLVEGTVASLRSHDPERALTGPVARGDAGTVERNLRAIGDDAPEYLAAYKLLGLRAITLARRSGGEPGKLAAIEKALRGVNPDG